MLSDYTGVIHGKKKIEKKLKKKMIHGIEWFFFQVTLTACLMNGYYFACPGSNCPQSTFTSPIPSSCTE